MYQIFIDEIAQNRNMSQEEVKALADGATMLGEMAKEKGLIDEIGMHSDVLDYIEKTYQIEPNVCWL
jgi:protease-4